jgi:hypothetical protein
MCRRIDDAEKVSLANCSKAQLRAVSESESVREEELEMRRAIDTPYGIS